MAGGAADLKAGFRVREAESCGKREFDKDFCNTSVSGNQADKGGSAEGIKRVQVVGRAGFGGQGFKRETAKGGAGFAG